MLHGRKNRSRQREPYRRQKLYRQKKLRRNKLRVQKISRGSIKMAYQIPCTGCSDCIPCPVELNIPEVFAIYNQFLTGEAEAAGRAYGELEHRAGECIRCSRCEKACPAGIGISAMMFEIREEMEE